MENIRTAKKLFGDISLPGDKSISHRAVMLGALARGRTTVTRLLDCDDCDYTIRAFRNMGIVIDKKKNLTIIEGKGLKGLAKPAKAIFVGNSGTTMRLLAGVLAGQDFETTLTGDESLSSRPMRRIVEPLSLMGVDIKAKDGEYPPLMIKGGDVRPIDYKMPVPSAQVKSAILFAALFANGVTRIEEQFKSRDHTERMLEYFGSKLKVDGLSISIEGNKELKGRDVEIPGDVSSASFFIIGAAILKGSKIRINKVGINPTRAGFLNLLSKMGVKIKILNKENLFEPVGDIEVRHSETNGIIINEDMIPAIIDELPIIFVLASLSRGRTVIKSAGELKFKETDRITSMKENLRRMGAKFETIGDEIIIEGVEKLKSADLKSFGDHRTCMAMIMAALSAEGDSVIDDIKCINKSFPEFFEVLKRIAKF